MRGKITIAQAKPVRHPESRHLFETAKRLIAKSPAALRVQSIGQAVHDGVDIRADVKPPDIGVVPDIYDDVDLLFRNDLRQTAKKLGGAGSSGEDRIVCVCHANILRGA